jgi:hypothetical protein
MFLLYHSEGCNSCGGLFRMCYINDLHTTTCSGMLGHRTNLASHSSHFAPRLFLLPPEPPPAAPTRRLPNIRWPWSKSSSTASRSQISVGLLIATAPTGLHGYDSGRQRYPRPHRELLLLVGWGIKLVDIVYLINFVSKCSALPF